jgi:hypothetical protein
MKSVIHVTNVQTILGDNGSSDTIGWIWMHRNANTDNLRYIYTNGTASQYPTFNNFFTSLDNQWIHIVAVCDYANKTLKAYRNGVQFGATQNLNGTPKFPFTDRIKYIGAYNIASGTYKIVDGSLDEVRIYNRGLSAEEVAAIYNQTKGKY